MASYLATTGVSELIWQAYGDAEATLSLLETVPSIGSKRTSGAGTVSSWAIQPSEADSEEAGIFANGRPIRRVPETLFPTSDDQYYRSTEKLQVPYWSSLGETISTVSPEMIAMVRKKHDVLKILKA